MTGEIKIVVGSWGSYMECNERALGSKWLKLSDYKNWEEIEEELKRQGFQLKGIDEELFIQDIEGVDVSDCDYTHPKHLFNILNDSGILDDYSRYELMEAYIEVNGWKCFEELVEKKGINWDDGLYLYPQATIEEVLEEMYDDCYDLNYDKLGWLSNYITIDYEAMARDVDNMYEVRNGVLEIA